MKSSLTIVMVATVMVGAASLHAQAPPATPQGRGGGDTPADGGPRPGAPPGQEASGGGRGRGATPGQGQTDQARLSRFRSENATLPAPSPGEDRVVFMGDSITDFWGKPGARVWDTGQFFPDQPYINRGISGQTTTAMLLRFRQDVINLKPKVVVILAGTNDIAGNGGPIELVDTQNNLASMADLARANGIGVVLCSVLPAKDFPWRPGQMPTPKIRELNAWIRQHAADHGYAWVDYYAAMADPDGAMADGLSGDGVHPTAKGYDVMAPLAQRGISEALTAQAGR